MRAIDDRVQPEVRDLDFPVVLITGITVRVYPDPEAVTAAWKRLVDRKRFDGALLVDCAGRARRIKTVRVLGNIGPFFGFDVFGNRNLRIAYEFASDAEPADLDAIRARVVRQWRIFDDTDEEYATDYERRLQTAADARSLIATVAEQYMHKLERTR